MDVKNYGYMHWLKKAGWGVCHRTISHGVSPSAYSYRSVGSSLFSRAVTNNTKSVLCRDRSIPTAFLWCQEKLAKSYVLNIDTKYKLFYFDSAFKHGVKAAFYKPACLCVWLSTVNRGRVTACTEYQPALTAWYFRLGAPPPLINVFLDFINESKARFITLAKYFRI